MANQINLLNQGLQNQQQAQAVQNNAPVMHGQNSTGDVVQQAGGGAYMNRARASQDADPLTTLGLTAAIGYGIGQGMDHFGPKCEGEYKDTILGKLGEKGDNFSQNTKVGRYIEGTFNKFDNWLIKKARTNKFAYWLKYHSTSPEWQFAKMPMHGLSGYWSTDMSNIIEKDLEPISAKPTKIFMFFPGPKINAFNRLADYGMSKDEILAFENSLKDRTFAEKAVALQKKELELLGFRPNSFAGKTLEEMQGMARDWKVTNRYKCANYGELEKKIKSILDDKDGFMRWLKDITKDGDTSISINKYDNSLWGRIKAHLAGRRVTLREYYNKGLAATGKGNKTVIGRSLPKALGWFLEGCTNRFSGGKLAPFIQATIFADMAYHVIKAPKGEHGKTFAERFVNDFSYFIAGTLGLIGLHKIGGWKYLGTDAAGREAYRAKQVAHNAKNAAKGFASKKLFNESTKAVDALLNTKGLKWYEKVLQKIGCFVNMGNEHFKPYLSPNKNNLNWLRRIMNTNVIGVPFRIWAVIFAFTPVVAKVLTKGVHAIFGKPTNSVLDEDMEQDDEQQSQAVQNMVNPQNPNAQTQPGVVDPNQAAYQSMANQTSRYKYVYPPQGADFATLAQAQNGQMPQNQMMPNQVQNPQMAQNPMMQNQAPNGQMPQNQMKPNQVQNPQMAQNPMMQNQTQVVNNNMNANNNSSTEQEPVRTYIPSPAGMVAQTPDQSAANAAMQMADKAEKEIQAVLSGTNK